MSNRFAALENFDQNVYSNVLLDTVNENSRIYENILKCCKLWFAVESSKLLNERQHAKFQCLQNKSQVNGNNLKKCMTLNDEVFQGPVIQNNDLETDSKEQKPGIYTEACMIWGGLLIPNQLSEE
jgi:hypothetical protein